MVIIRAGKTCAAPAATNPIRAGHRTRTERRACTIAAVRIDESQVAPNGTVITQAARDLMRAHLFNEYALEPTRDVPSRSSNIAPAVSVLSRNPATQG